MLKKIIEISFTFLKNIMSKNVVIKHQKCIKINCEGLLINLNIEQQNRGIEF